MDTFLRSCAGYSVITYVLGVGDRHLDNLLMKSSGEFMHVDFGYMFGRDPKPFKPQLRFTQEMLLAMVGEDSPLYEKFLQYCCLSYNIIRRSSVVILSYLRMTCHVGISDLSVKQSPADAILAVSDRLQLDLDDNRAFEHMRSVIEDSQSAVMPVVMEQMHRIASVWR
jgi:phosphatidylinositol 3-kinase